MGMIDESKIHSAKALHEARKAEEAERIAEEARRQAENAKRDELLTEVKEIKGQLKGVTSLAAEPGALSLKRYRATVSVTQALDAAGVDYKGTLKAVLKLGRHERKALTDMTLTPAELAIPAPEGFTAERNADLCKSFADSISSSKELFRARLWALVATVFAVVGPLVASLF